MKPRLNNDIENPRKYLGINKELNINKKLQFTDILKKTPNKSKSLKYPKKIKKKSINLLVNECNDILLELQSTKSKIEQYEKFINNTIQSEPINENVISRIKDIPENINYSKSFIRFSKPDKLNDERINNNNNLSKIKNQFEISDFNKFNNSAINDKNKLFILNYK